jgi:hypothetical protein
VDIEVTESGLRAAPSAPRERVGRRALLGAGVGGVALSLLPFLSSRAGASATTDGGSTTTSTTTPPQRPTDDDVTLLGFAQQVELTSQALYDEAIALGGWSDAQAAVIAAIREAHQAYAQSLSGLLGRKAPGLMSKPLFDSLRSDFSGSADGVLSAAYDLESSLVATHLDVLAKLQGTDAAALLASIVSNEARHGTVLADLAGKSDEATLLVFEESAALTAKG